MFKLHHNFLSKTLLHEFPLCKVLLEDEKYYPWLLLIPKRDNVSKIMDLSPTDQLQLISEMDWAQKILWEVFEPDQLNVAAIGNKTPQLHIHVIARFKSDPAWPRTVWDHPEREPYLAGDLEKSKKILQAKLNTYR